MQEPKAIRDLERLKWVGVLLPIAFIWGFELVRFLLLERNVEPSDAHVISALVMASGVLLFGASMAVLLDRTQRQLIRQNRDLTALSAVGSAVHGDHPIRALMRQALERLLDETGALAATIRVRVVEGEELVDHSPALPPDGLAWTRALLDEHREPHAGPTYVEHPALDALTLDLPLAIDSLAVGNVRLVFHPNRRPELSPTVLAELSREISTGIRLAQLLGDLRRREREQGALHEVALQLARRAEMREVLDTISQHARDLLKADRAAVCLAAAPADEMTAPTTARLAIADDGSACWIAHRGGGSEHPRNPLCPLAGEHLGGEWLARSLRAPDARLGELCAIRAAGPPFTDSEGRLLAGLADLAAVAVRTARLHETEQQWTILTERDRIARELHDSLAQVLGHIHLRLRGLEATVATSPVREELSDLAEVADEAYRDVREAILGLRETISSEGGLEGALREYLAKFTRQTAIQATLECSRASVRDLDPRAEVQLLRVVQEALTNVRKHAHASRVAVRISARGGSPVLSIEDDGVGFDPGTVVESLTGGFGLSAMRERVEQIGGRLEIETEHGTGTRIVVRLRREEVDGAPASAPAVAAGR